MKKPAIAGGSAVDVGCGSLGGVGWMRQVWNVAVVIYGVGYLLFVATAGITAWSEMTFMQWWNYMAWQVGVYGPLWPFMLFAAR